MSERDIIQETLDSFSPEDPETRLIEVGGKKFVVANPHRVSSKEPFEYIHSHEPPEGTFEEYEPDMVPLTHKAPKGKVYNEYPYYHAIGWLNPRMGEVNKEQVKLTKSAKKALREEAKSSGRDYYKFSPTYSDFESRSSRLGESTLYSTEPDKYGLEFSIGQTVLVENENKPDRSVGTYEVVDGPITSGKSRRYKVRSFDTGEEFWEFVSYIRPLPEDIYNR